MNEDLPLALRGRMEGMDPYDPEEEAPTGLLRLPLLLALGLLVLLILAAALVPIGGAVVGTGRVAAESRVKQVAHPIGGIVAALLVRDGQHVRAGQALVRLDDRVSGTEAELSRLSVDQLLAQKARLEAERMGAPALRFPDALATRRDAEALRAMEDERQMFAMHRSERNGLAAQLEARIGQYRQQIVGYRAQIAALRRQSALIGPERAAVQQLYDKKLVTITRLNQLERTAADLDGSVGALSAQIAQAQAQIAETRAQIIQLDQSRRVEAGTRLAEVEATLNQQQIRTASAADAQGHMVIRAPHDGVVDKLAVTTIGGIVRPAETLMEIVPDRDRLLVEGAIAPGDVDQVHVGQAVRVRFSSLGGGVAPEASGRLVYVAAERTDDPDGRRSFYAVRVALNPVGQPRAIVLKPGMPADIYIVTGRRSMLSYVTRPLREQFARAFRDN